MDMITSEVERFWEDVKDSQGCDYIVHFLFNHSVIQMGSNLFTLLDLSTYVNPHFKVKKSGIKHELLDKL